jgi:hypothetical protein
MGVYWVAGIFCSFAALQGLYLFFLYHVSNTRHADWKPDMRLEKHQAIL